MVTANISAQFRSQEPSKEVHKYTSSSPTPRRSETASLYNYRISSFIGAGHDTGAVTSDGVGARVTSVADALGNVNRLLAVVPDGD